jgi:hypothetical protein
MSLKEFTIEEGIEIQKEHLAGWKTVLITEVYEALEEYALRDNDKARSGYSVCRGTSLDNYVNNYMLGHRF